MKRPRENSHQHSNCGENDNSRSPIEDMADKSLFPHVVAHSPRKQHSRRPQNQRNSTLFLPKNLLLGLCILVTLTFSGIPSLPAAHALSSSSSSTARNMGFTDSPRFSSDEFIFRRINEIQQVEETIEECIVPVTKCTQCTFSEQRSFDICKETGKWQKFKCIMPGETGTESGDDDPDYREETRSCKYTDFDNVFAMFQLQFFCLFIGVLSIISVKKQKKLSMSMFDRRKQQGATSLRENNNVGNNKRSDGHIAYDDEEDIEFTPMTNQQRERVPLVARMEII